MDLFAATRSRIAANHALITSDTHVRSPLVGWEKAEAVIHITPQLGARFMQYSAFLDAGGQSAPLNKMVERFVFVQEGAVTVNGATAGRLGAGGFAYFAAGDEHTLLAEQPTTLVVFEKQYQPLAPHSSPPTILGNESEFSGEPFCGDPDAMLKTLLPIDPAFDMAVNIFTYQPGAALPQVEVHVMEHGLLMLDGAGVYRLGDDYYPVQAGDVIWMASFCPQWFVAMGKKPARYIYYKDIHRDGLQHAS